MKNDDLWERFTPDGDHLFDLLLDISENDYKISLKNKIK